MHGGILHTCNLVGGTTFFCVSKVPSGSDCGEAMTSQQLLPGHGGSRLGGGGCLCSYPVMLGEEGEDVCV